MIRSEDDYVFTVDGFFGPRLVGTLGRNFTCPRMRREGKRGGERRGEEKRIRTMGCDAEFQSK